MQNLNCACVYYNTLLLHKIEKMKMAESIREISSEMGDNHGNFDLFSLDSRVRIKTSILSIFRKRGTLKKNFIY